MNNERCRVSEDELNHDRESGELEALAEDQRAQKERDLKDCTDAKYQEIIAGDGKAVMEILADEWMNYSLDQDIWEAFSGKSKYEVGQILEDAMFEIVMDCAKDQAEEELEI